MDNETKTKLFNENIGTAFAATKKVRRVYLNTEFSDANRALLDSEEWSQVVKLCAWELLDRYDPSRGKVTTFFYVALPRRVSMHINGFNADKDKNGDYRGGINNSYGKSKYRKGISHFSFHGRTFHHADSIFRTENIQLVNEALSVDGKFPNFGEVMDFGEVDVIEINKQVNTRAERHPNAVNHSKSNMSTAKMIEARFGIGSYERSHTLEDIGNMAGNITRERVRQRIDEGLKRIKRAVKSHRESVKLELWRKEREAKLQLAVETIEKCQLPTKENKFDDMIWVMQQYRD
tara:strand:+ start:267 stop:1139 length:873 start_codon:yes stop_codon:yes gene_type:complete